MYYVRVFKVNPLIRCRYSTIYIFVCNELMTMNTFIIMTFDFDLDAGGWSCCKGEVGTNTKLIITDTTVVRRMLSCF